MDKILRQHPTIALFGESEKGEYHTPYFCNNLENLVDQLGNPPEESRGLHLAIQTILYEHPLIFFRVREEGFSFQDYYWGFHHLEKESLMSRTSAVCVPGVGDSEIIHSLTTICVKYHNILITTEADLYDYLHDRLL